MSAFRARARGGVAAAAVAVVLAVALRPARAPLDFQARATGYRTSDAALDALQPLFRATLETNRREFRGASGPVAGFGAGEIYPQIWVRDSATLTPLIRWHYPRPFLASWIEEHLAQQRGDGSVNDWFATGAVSHFAAYAPRAIPGLPAPDGPMSVDRNTSAADQESSVVLAAARVVAITGDVAWLRRPLRSIRLLDRLDNALEYVFAERRDAATGLVTAAFSPDWGDVSPAHGDQQVIYLDEATPVVAALYPSALFAGAARALAGLHRAAGRAERAGAWEERADAMGAAVRAALWQPGRGFFAMHRVVSAPPGWTAPDDAGQFALGGNAMAMLHGVADASQCASIVEAAERARAAHGLPTIGFVLVPPYPAGTFRHPMLREPWTYQNGGEWDWWAGRFVLAEFRCGRSEAARRHLGELARAALDAGGLHEWRDREGRGQGSARYAGSAGALGAAIYEGLFGIDLRADGLDITVRLGGLRGDVRAWQPATRTGASYRYEWDADRRSITMAFEADAPGTGALRVLLPRGASVAAARLDGREAPAPAVERLGADTYAVLRTDWSPHRLQLVLR